MKRTLPILLSACCCLLSGCGMISELRGISQEGSVQERILETQPEVQPTHSAKISPDFPELEHVDEDSILLRLHSDPHNAAWIGNYFIPAAGEDYTLAFIEDGKTLEQCLERYSANETPEPHAGDALTTAYRIGNDTIVFPTNFRMSGNGYAYYDGGLDEKSVLENFDLLAHDKRILYRRFRDDPEIKCIAYDFYAVEDAGDGTAAFGWYCYLIDREDHLVSTVPEWNQIIYVEIPERQEESSTQEQQRVQETSEDVLTDQELADMETVDLQISTLLDSDEWKQSDTPERRVLVNGLLKRLSQEDLIQYTPSAENEDVINFSYACGVRGGIKLTEFDERMN